MANELIIELPKANALQVFTEEKGINPYLEKIRIEAMSHFPDVETKKGREEIASIAFKVSKCKTYLEKAGKELCDQERKKIDATLSAVMASRKRIESELDALRDEVRKPLTDWEAAEAARKAKIELRIESMSRLPDLGSSSELIQKHLKRLEATEIDESFGEFTADAALTRTKAMRECKAALDAQLKVEQDLKELAKLRIRNAEQEQKDREAEIARNAAYIATQKAELEAQAKIDQAKAELEAERAAIQAAEREEELRIAEENKRKNDEKHKQVIRNQAILDLQTAGFGIQESELIIKLIEGNFVSHVTINF